MQTRIIPSASYAAGSYTLDLPNSVSKKYAGIKLTLTREDWPGASTLTNPATAAATTWTVANGAQQFPVAAGGFDTGFLGQQIPRRYGRLSVVSGGNTEIVALHQRVGNTLTVIRGQENSTPLALSAGDVVTLLDLVTAQFELSEDNGQTWTKTEAFTASGGVILDGLGQPVLDCGATFLISLNGQPIERHGDVRVVFTVRMTATSELRLDLLEVGDF